MTDVGAYDALGLGLGLGANAAAPAVRLRIASPVTGPEELAAIAEVLASGLLTNGPATRRFEAAMAQRHGSEHAVAFANGTVALAAMYLAVGIGPGDEVIVPSLTFISTATSVLHVGATPVFADVMPDTLNLDPDDVVRHLTPRTRAIVPVHYGGQAADLDRLRDVADGAGASLLEDAAEAHGAAFAGRPVGSWGDAAMFSFTPTKNITTGEGSIVTTGDGDLARRLRLLRNHGLDAPYHHATLGWNWRLSELQAAMGEVQVGRLDAIIARKRANATRLTANLGGVAHVRPPVEAPGRDHTYMLYTIQVAGDRRDAVARRLAAAGIESRVYFPPAHHQPVVATHRGGAQPVTDELSGRILSLPVHTAMTDADLDEVAAVVASAVAL